MAVRISMLTPDIWVRLLVLGLLSATSAAARAHSLPVTGVVIHLGSQATTVSVSVHIPLLSGADPADAIAPRVRVRLDGVPFHPSHIDVQRDPVQDTVTWSATETRTARRIAVDAPIFPDHPEDTTVVLLYQQEGGAQEVLSGRMVLTPTHPAAVVGDSLSSTLGRFLFMGIEHILSGPDHILFLLGLILAGGTLRQLFGLVTAFTLAHSLTLSLTALRIATLSPSIVEPMIAFSIVVVGLENLRRSGSQYPLRVGLAFGFGFFHGFGFADALTEAGLPQDVIASSLAAFNIGGRDRPGMHPPGRPASAALHCARESQRSPAHRPLPVHRHRHRRFRLVHPARLNPPTAAAGGGGRPCLCGIELRVVARRRGRSALRRRDRQEPTPEVSGRFAITPLRGQRRRAGRLPIAWSGRA